MQSDRRHMGTSVYNADPKELQLLEATGACEQSQTPRHFLGSQEEWILVPKVRRFTGNQDFCAKTALLLLYALKRTRTSQKINRSSGSMVRIRYKPVLNKAGAPHCRKQPHRAVRGPQKKRPGGDKQPETHTPEMPRDASCAKNAPTHKHADVPRGGEETHGTHEQVHARRDPIFGPFRGPQSV